MYNWSTDEEKLKRDPELYAIWKLEQMINFGLGGEKLDHKLLVRHWDRLALDPHRKKYLAFLLYGERSRHTNQTPTRTA